MTSNHNQKDIMKLAANVFQDKQQSLSNMENFSNLANLAYNKSIQTETNYENLSNIMKKIAEMTIANENNLTKFNELLDDTRNIAIDAKNISSTNNINGLINQSKSSQSNSNQSNSSVSITTQASSIQSNQYAKIFSEIIEAKNIAIEAKQLVSDQKKMIDFNLKNIDTKFNANLDKFNKHITKITSSAENSSNIANSTLDSLNNTYTKFNQQIENMPKVIKPKLYGDFDKLLSNPDFNGLMSENSLYLINTDTSLIKIDDNLIFKANTKYLVLETKKIIDIISNYDQKSIIFFNYNILEESINYITEFGLYIIPKNSDLVKFSHIFQINNYIDNNDKVYFVSNKLLHDSFIEINKQIYMCGPFCNISNYDIYESEQDETILEIFIKDEINNIQLDDNSNKYFYIKQIKQDDKYYLMAKQSIKQDTFNNSSLIKLIVYLIDQNNIPFPRLFYLNINQSISSFNEIINIENNSLKVILLEYYNIIKSRSLIFTDLYNLIQTILPNNCQIIKILAKQKQNIENNNIYIDSEPQTKDNILSFVHNINNLVLIQKNIIKNSTIDDYFDLIEAINKLINCTKTLSPKYVSDIILKLSEKYCLLLNSVIKIINSYLSETRYDSKQYNINKFSDFIKTIFPILSNIKEIQINLITELSVFDGF